MKTKTVIQSGFAQDLSYRSNLHYPKHHISCLYNTKNKPILVPPEKFTSFHDSIVTKKHKRKNKVKQLWRHKQQSAGITQLSDSVDMRTEAELMSLTTADRAFRVAIKGDVWVGRCSNEEEFGGCATVFKEEKEPW